MSDDTRDGQENGEQTKSSSTDTAKETIAALELAKMQAEIALAEESIKKKKRLDAHQRAQPVARGYVPFFGNVTMESVKDVTVLLGHVSRLRPGEPITIVVSSRGGNLSEAFALYDYIVELRDQEEHAHEITIVVRGYLFGNAVILLQAASPGKRIIGANASYVISKESSAQLGDTTIQEHRLALVSRWEKRSLAILAERSKLSPRQINNRWRESPWELDAEETVEHGFADLIG